MRTDPNPGDCCVGIHKVGFPFSRALEMLGGSRWGAPAGVSIWAVSALELVRWKWEKAGLGQTGVGSWGHESALPSIPQPLQRPRELWAKDRNLR